MTIVFVDTETLGLDPDRHAIWEVGTITYDERAREVRAEQVWQLALTEDEVNQGDLTGMSIGGWFHRRWPMTKLTAPNTFASTFAQYTAGAHLAGAVVSFDEERLRRLLQRHDVDPSWHYHLIDVEALAVGWLNGYADAAGSEDDDNLRVVGRTLPWDSDALSAALDVTISENTRHTAIGDARWALNIWRAVME